MNYSNRTHISWQNTLIEQSPSLLKGSDNKGPTVVSIMLLLVFVYRITHTHVCHSFQGRLDAVDVKKAVSFILSCMNFDGGFGCIPGSESHAGQVGIEYIQSCVYV